jgi:hypothetical protein
LLEMFTTQPHFSARPGEPLPGFHPLQTIWLTRRNSPGGQ